MPNILVEIWGEIKEYVKHLSGHIIIVVITILTLWIITSVLDSLFPNPKPITCDIIEITSQCFIVILFIYYIVRPTIEQLSDKRRNA